MGIISTIGRWVSTALPAVMDGIGKAARLLEKGAVYVERLMEGRSFISEDEERREAPKNDRSKRPDILDDEEGESGWFAKLLKQIDDSRRSLQKVDAANTSEHKRIRLQIDVMELIVSASTVERFANNINIHAANLQIHLHTIQNTSGLLDNVNRQRVAIKTIMRTVNHLINVTGSKSKVDPISGIDVDIKAGTISIFGAYEAYENTKHLLLSEIESYLRELDDQSKRIEAVREAARATPRSAEKVNAWLVNSVEPALADAKDLANSLAAEIRVLPAMESRLKRGLEREIESESGPASEEI